MGYSGIIMGKEEDELEQLKSDIEVLNVMMQEFGEKLAELENEVFSHADVLTELEERYNS